MLRSAVPTTLGRAALLALAASAALAQEPTDADLGLEPVAAFVREYGGAVAPAARAAGDAELPPLPPLNAFLRPYLDGPAPGLRLALGMSPRLPAAYAGATASEQRVVADFIAARYRIGAEAAGPVVAQAYQAGREAALDPLLILAVIAVESSFRPEAVSVAGALGLMQVMPKFHKDKVALHGDDDVLFVPRANIRVGAQILREYLSRLHELEPALQKYAGAADDASAAYARRVLAERSLLERTVAHLRRET